MDNDPNEMYHDPDKVFSIEALKVDGGLVTNLIKKKEID